LIGATAGALLVAYSGLASATAAVHLLHERQVEEAVPQTLGGGRLRRDSADDLALAERIARDDRPSGEGWWLGPKLAPEPVAAPGVDPGGEPAGLPGPVPAATSARGPSAPGGELAVAPTTLVVDTPAGPVSIEADAALSPDDLVLLLAALGIADAQGLPTVTAGGPEPVPDDLLLVLALAAPSMAPSPGPAERTPA
jgi:hypothetical protein